MRLTKFSDFAFRLLIMAASRPGRNITIEEAAQTYGVSAPHLKKVVTALTRGGILDSTRGRSGGFRLAMPPDRIGLGQVLRTTEPDFGLVECYLPDNACALTGFCRLPAILNQALGGWFAELDSYTLADIMLDPQHVGALSDRHGRTSAPANGAEPGLPD